MQPGAGREKASQVAQEKAQERAHELRQEVDRLRAGGLLTAAGIARELTQRGVLTPRGKAGWTATQVIRLGAKR